MEQTIQIIDNDNVKITLKTAVVRGGTEYHTIALRAPVGADMEGLSQDLIKIKHTDQIQKLVHKISNPTITRSDYMKMGMDDLNVINAAIDFFSAPPSAKAEMEAALAELKYLPESESEPQTQPE